MSASMEAILAEVAAGRLAPDEAARRLRRSQDLGFAVVDHERADRCGFPEVVLCEHKTPEHTRDIALEVLKRAPRVLLTRADPAHVDAVLSAVPDATHHETARCLHVDREPRPTKGRVAVVAAGTSDLPVAEEAAVTATALGASVDRHIDVGVAGIHRLLDRLPQLREADAVVAAAGMEGALPSVLAGLMDVPVLAVPTSTGYGVGQGGLAALATMLGSCAAGVAAVNIDNGFGAGYLAAQIARAVVPRSNPDNLLAP